MSDGLLACKSDALRGQLKLPESEATTGRRAPMTDESLLVRIFVEAPKTAKELADEEAKGWGWSNVRTRISKLRKAGLIEQHTLVLTQQGRSFVGDDALGEGLNTA